MRSLYLIRFRRPYIQQTTLSAKKSLDFALFYYHFKFNTFQHMIRTPGTPRKTKKTRTQHSRNTVASQQMNIILPQFTRELAFTLRRRFLSCPPRERGKQERQKERKAGRQKERKKNENERRGALPFIKLPWRSQRRAVHSDYPPESHLAC